MLIELNALFGNEGNLFQRVFRSPWSLEIVFLVNIFTENNEAKESEGWLRVLFHQRCPM